MLISDNDLVTSIQQGKTENFVELYEKYVKKIFDFIFFKVGNKQDAEDLTSDTFLKAFDKIKTFNPQKNIQFSSRLYSIARNTTIDFFRQNHTDYPEYTRLEDQSVEIDMLQGIQDRDKLHQILQFLDTLGTEKKEIFLLRVWNEMSYDEIAHITGKTANTCKVTFHRTLQTVVQKFGYMGLCILLITIK